LLGVRGGCPGPVVRQLAYPAVLSHPGTLTRHASPLNPLVPKQAVANAHTRSHTDGWCSVTLEDRETNDDADASRR
jgi:hypothetical protein